MYCRTLLFNSRRGGERGTLSARRAPPAHVDVWRAQARYKVTPHDISQIGKPRYESCVFRMRSDGVPVDPSVAVRSS